MGAARDFGGEEVYKRLLKSKSEAVIAMIDCDCRVSPNYIEELIFTFQNPVVNGSAGKWLIKIDSKLPCHELVAKALEMHLGKNLLEKDYKPVQKRLPFKYQKKDKMVKNILINGQNMAIRVSAWQKAGGMMHLKSFEDLILGAKITDLPGDVVYNPNFTVTTLARKSDRVGMTGFGRRVEYIVKSAAEYHKGKIAEVHVPELYNLFQFFVRLFHVYSQHLLNERILENLLSLYGVNVKTLTKEEMKILLRLAKNEFGQKQQFKKNGELKTESLLEKLYHLFPGQKVEAV